MIVAGIAHDCEGQLNRRASDTLLVYPECKFTFIVASDAWLNCSVTFVARAAAYFSSYIHTRPW